MTTDSLATKQIVALGSLGGERAKALRHRLAAVIGSDSPELLSVTREAKAFLELNGIQGKSSSESA